MSARGEIPEEMRQPLRRAARRARAADARAAEAEAELRAAVAAAMASGAGLRAVAAFTGRPVTTIKRWLGAKPEQETR